MSMKNHRIVNGQLLQTNKKFSHLNQDQKNMIAEWIYEEYRSICATHGRVPNKEDDVQIVLSVMERITDEKMWIPEGEIITYYRSKKHYLYERWLNEKSVNKGTM